MGHLDYCRHAALRVVVAALRPLTSRGRMNLSFGFFQLRAVSPRRLQCTLSYSRPWYTSTPSPPAQSVWQKAPHASVGLCARRHVKDL